MKPVNGSYLTSFIIVKGLIFLEDKVEYNRQYYPRPYMALLLPVCVTWCTGTDVTRVSSDNNDDIVRMKP